MTTEKLILSIPDFAILAITLLISASIGIYFRFSGNKQKTNEEYLLAGKDMSILPVAVSLMATYFSAITLMGMPAEIYLYGTNMTFLNIGFFLGPAIAAYLFIPIYFRAGISTAYEYLEKRFGRSTRTLLSSLYVIQNIMYTAVALYAPALALNAVTSISLEISIVSIGFVCTFYSAMGGMKAVLWTDVFQTILMYVCLLTIVIKGCLDLGGITQVFRIAHDGGRLVVPKFSFNLESHYTMISVVAVALIRTTGAYAVNQEQVQRIMTLRNSKRATIAILLSVPIFVTFNLLCCLCGLIFYAYFRTCDPLTSPDKPIQAADQIIPFYIATALNAYPGLPGLCIAGIFSASLSSISSQLNAFAAVMTVNFIKPVWPNLSKSVLLTKTLCILDGILCITLSFFINSIGNLIKTTIIVVGTIVGPNLAVFLLGCLTTTANEEGVILGVVAGLAVSSYLNFGPALSTYPRLPFSNECHYQNFTSNVTNTPYITPPPTIDPLNTHDPSHEDSFRLSYLWIIPFATVTCLIISYISSFIVRCFRDKPDVPTKYMTPIRCCFSEHVSQKKISKKFTPLLNEEINFQMLETATITS
ncbi:putative sodium-dependent multivitamin transporter [Stegodyphus dumicola]|uniref:putative sodium-dependent multivitamin transporter n=1 Tax=Stegodyphus dumicola TaxID=202533 RepID=UPI0015B1A228|nr:putative sodium-dependent multivitamin transporter [Stegodyphus dumicola]